MTDIDRLRAIGSSEHASQYLSIADRDAILRAANTLERLERAKDES